MFKRPILFAAMVSAMAIGLFCHFLPQLFYPVIPFENYEELYLTGRVQEVVMHSASADVYLTGVRAGELRLGKAVLVLSLQEAEALSLKAGYQISSACTYRPFRTAANYGNYDEKSYYASQGIFFRADSEQTVVTVREVWVFREFLNEIRTSLVQSIYAAVEDPETAGILAAICTGDREGLTAQAKSLYQRSGIIHILAISGLHISLVGMTVFRLLRRRLRYLPAATISVFIMLGFCIMSDASPSAVRATIMFVIQMAGICLGKQVDILCSWSAAFLIMLFYRPLLITSSGFVLSFLAVLAVGTLFQSLCAFFRIAKARGYVMKTQMEALAGWKGGTKQLAESFLMSLSVNLMLLPVTAFVYYEIPVYAILLNLLVIPLMSMVLGIGLLSAGLGLIRVMIGRFFAGAGVYLVWFIQWCCTLTEGLPVSSIITGCPEPWRLCLYYGMLLGMHLGFLAAARRRPLAKKIRKRIVPLLIMIVILLSVILIGKRPVLLRLSFFDVGQGDGILIENPSGTVYLIDGGSSSVQQVGKYRLEGAVKYYGIARIDYSIITHPDADHISGMMEILSGMADAGKGRRSGNLSIGTILIPAVPDSSNYDELCDLAKQKGVQVMDLYAGMQLKDGDLVLTCLYPEKGVNYDTVNGYSAVMDLEYGGFSALLTGDLEEEGEMVLLKDDPAWLRENYDVLKVAHHGSRYSSTEAFLQRVCPDLAIISAGVNNRYGHPHFETLERLNDIGARILVTASTGEIIIEAGMDGIKQIRTKLH